MEDKVRQSILYMASYGTPQSVIAEMNGISQSTVSKVLAVSPREYEQLHKLSDKKSRSDAEVDRGVIDEVYNRYMAGEKLTALCEEYGIKYQSTYNRVRRIREEIGVSRVNLESDEEV